MSTAGRQGITSRLIEGITGIFMPLANLLSAGGILKGIMAILVAAGTISRESQSYLVLDAVTDSLFYFLPFLLAVTAAKKFGANPYMGMVIAGILLYPALSQTLSEGQTIYFFGLPLKGVIYRSGVLPIILAVGLQSHLEKLLNRVLPEMIRGFMLPLVCIPIVAIVSLAVFGPIGAVTGDALAAGYQYVYSLAPIVAGFLLGGAVQPMVLFGFHWSFLLLGMNNVLVTGSDTVLPLIGPAVFAQAGAALAVMIKSRDTAFRSICASAVLSALFGITEPALFNISLPRKKPLIAVCIGGAVGGALTGASGLVLRVFTFPSLVSMPVYYGEGFGLYLTGCLAGFLIAFTFSMLMRYPVDTEEATPAFPATSPSAPH